MLRGGVGDCALEGSDRGQIVLPTEYDLDRVAAIVAAPFISFVLTARP